MANQSDLQTQHDRAEQTRHRAHVRQHLEHLAHALTYITARLEADLPKPRRRENINVSPTMAPWDIYTNDYRHTRLWAAQAMTIDLENMAGIITGYPLNAGWNVLDASNRDRIRTASTQAVLILEWTDYAV